MATRKRPPAGDGAAGAAPKRPGVRQLAAQASRDNILRAAIKIFAKYGYDGATVDKISTAAKSYDRMIYYYFDSKEGLFIAVIEEIYRRYNEAEAALKLDFSDPVAALQDVVRFTLHYYRDKPEFVTLLNSENLHRGKHISKSNRAREYSLPAINIIDRLLRDGARQGVLRGDVPARDVYLMIAALGYFYQSNRYSLSSFLGEDMQSAAAFARWEAFVIEAVLRTTRPLASPAARAA